MNWTLTLALFHRCPIIQILGLVGLNLKVMVASDDSNPDDLISFMGEKLHGHIWRPAEDKFKCLLYLSIYLRVHLNLLISGWEPGRICLCHLH